METLNMPENGSWLWRVPASASPEIDALANNMGIDRSKLMHVLLAAGLAAQRGGRVRAARSDRTQTAPEMAEKVGKTMSEREIAVEIPTIPGTHLPPESPCEPQLTHDQSDQPATDDSEQAAEMAALLEAFGESFT
jgi:hypothetical protein